MNKSKVLAMLEALRLEMRAASINNTLTAAVDNHSATDEQVDLITAEVTSLRARADRWAASGTRGIGSYV